MATVVFVFVEVAHGRLVPTIHIPDILQPIDGIAIYIEGLGQNEALATAGWPVVSLGGVQRPPFALSHPAGAPAQRRRLSG